MGKNSGKWAASAVAAGVAGYVVGVLTAPKSGKETREEIRKASANARSDAEKKFKLILTDLNARLDEAKSKGENVTGRGRKEFEKMYAQATDAKEKVRQIISGLHDGDADDPELKRALKDAQGALKHLEKYIKK
ncbi:MAG: YtxH domain-containing protein [bacterium]|nr:YtxH domain-containing protein [bacterium]